MKVNVVKLKEIAKLISEKEDNDEKILNFLFNKLNKLEFKLFLKYLKKENEQNTVIIKTAIEPGEKFKQIINRLFYGKKIIFKEDKGLGAGIEIKDSDNFLNLNINSIISETVDSLKQNL